MEKQYIRGNITKPFTECKNCNKTIMKNNNKQIIYFCSRQCRKEFREIKPNCSINKNTELTKTT